MLRSDQDTEEEANRSPFSATDQNANALTHILRYLPCKRSQVNSQGCQVRAKQCDDTRANTDMQFSLQLDICSWRSLRRVAPARDRPQSRSGEAQDRAQKVGYDVLKLSRWACVGCPGATWMTIVANVQLRAFTPRCQRASDCIF